MLVNRVPARLFLDTGVIVDGCVSRWGAAKIVTSLLAVQPERFVFVFAARVEIEVAQAVKRRQSSLSPERA